MYSGLTIYHVSFQVCSLACISSCDGFVITIRQKDPRQRLLFSPSPTPAYPTKKTRTGNCWARDEQCPTSIQSFQQPNKEPTKRIYSFLFYFKVIWTCSVGFIIWFLTQCIYVSLGGKEMNSCEDLLKCKSDLKYQISNSHRSVRCQLIDGTDVKTSVCEWRHSILLSGSNLAF